MSACRAQRSVDRIGPHSWLPWHLLSQGLHVAMLVGRLKGTKNSTALSAPTHPRYPVTHLWPLFSMGVGQVPRLGEDIERRVRAVRILRPCPERRPRRPQCGPAQRRRRKTMEFRKTEAKSGFSNLKIGGYLTPLGHTPLGSFRRWCRRPVFLCFINKISDAVQTTCLTR